MRKHIFALVFFASCVAMAQDSLFVKAQQYMNASRWIEAQNILKQGLREGGDTMLYSYELAWAYYSNKEYAQAIKTLAPFLNKDDSPSEIYQLLGNAYDENGNSYKAVDIYKQGLAKYPKAGNLFLEIGNIEFKKGNFKDALYWYEKGIENDPLFASNYYRAAKVFFMSTEMVWGIMYGEIFMLLSDDNERKQQMSKDLCEAYFSCIKEIDGKPKADFNNNIIVYSDSYERKNLFPQVYNNTMQNCLKSVKSLNIANLINIRKSFINRLYQENSDFDNILFSYQKQLLSQGLFDAYCYHLYAYGEPKTAGQWINSNKAQWERFQKYIKTHPIPISAENYFSRYLME